MTVTLLTAGDQITAIKCKLGPTWQRSLLVLILVARTVSCHTKIEMFLNRNTEQRHAMIAIITVIDNTIIDACMAGSLKWSHFVLQT